MGTTIDIKWEREDPATPALIEPMLADEYGSDKPDSQEMSLALEKTAEYCRYRIKHYIEFAVEPLTMAEMSREAEHFLAGYMAALTGEIKSL